MLAALVASALQGGCGRGGAIGPPPRTAILTLSATATGAIPAGTLVTGYDVTVALPAGVTVRSARPPEVDGGDLGGAGPATGSLVTGVYTAASAGAPGAVRVQVANGSGLGVGPFGALRCVVAGGRAVAATDFGPLRFTAYGFDPRAGSTVEVTGQLTLATAVVDE